MARQDVSRGVAETLVRETTDGRVTRAEADQLFTAVYHELHSMARERMRHERPDHTLRPTALLSEVYLRLVAAKPVHHASMAHFFGVAARAMCEVLIDHKRRHGAQKRGADQGRVPLMDDVGISGGREIRAGDLARTLDTLADMHARMARVVELRVFAGLSGREIAGVLGVSRKTVVQDWQVAAMWLRAQLAGEEDL